MTAACLSILLPAREHPRSSRWETSPHHNKPSLSPIEPLIDVTAIDRCSQNQKGRSATPSNRSADRTTLDPRQGSDRARKSEKEMLSIFLLSFSIVWTSVLSVFVLRDWRLLLKVLRWTTSIWLVGFGIAVSEVLREGLIVNGESLLHWDVRVAWTSWFVLVAASVLDWRFLVPAVALPLWFLSYPEVRFLLNFGLVRLQLLNVVHNPLTWALDRLDIFDVSSRGNGLFSGFWWWFVSPVLSPMRGLMGYAASWFMRTTDQGLEKLRPPPRWSWIPFAGRS